MVVGQISDGDADAALCWAFSASPLYVIQLIAGIQLRALKGRTLGMLAAIVFALPGCGCYCVSLPLTIYLLVLLNDPEITAAFEQEAKHPTS